MNNFKISISFKPVGLVRVFGNLGGGVLFYLFIYLSIFPITINNIIIINLFLTKIRVYVKVSRHKHFRPRSTLFDNRIKVTTGLFYSVLMCIIYLGRYMSLKKE